MQKPFAPASMRNTSKTFSLSRRQVSTITFLGVIVAFVIGSTLIDVRHDYDVYIAQSSVSSFNEFSTGMPLP
jgi:hypothetical protein